MRFWFWVGKGRRFWSWFDYIWMKKREGLKVTKGGGGLLVLFFFFFLLSLVYFHVGVSFLIHRTYNCANEISESE